MAFLAKNPRLRATVCDRPAALEVAREIATTRHAGARLSYLPLDLLKDDIPGLFDVIWYSNVLHIYSPQENLNVFRRARAALAEGGRLIVQDAFLHDREGLFPEEASLFAVTMLLFTETGNTYSMADTAAWLKNAGFASVRPVEMTRGREDWEGGIIEALVPVRRSKMRGRRSRSARNSHSR
jgi:SAM-dependent methyltransferase